MTDASPALSLETVVEILKAYLSKTQDSPSERALAELSAASGQQVHAIRGFYEKEHDTIGGQGDPWQTPNPGYHPY